MHKLLAVLLAIAFGLIVTGVCLWSVPAGLITAGLLLGIWAVLILLNVDDEASS